MGSRRTIRLLALCSGVALATGCTPDPEAVTTCTGLAPDAPLLVLETDYVSSALGRLDENGCLTERPSLVLGADPTLCSDSERAFVCIRDQSRIAEIDPKTGLLMPDHIWNVTPGDGTVTRGNPWWVLPLADGTLWVLRYDLSSIAILDEHGTLTGAVDLAALADGDGIPEMARAAESGGRVYVLLQRLDRTQSYAPTQTGLLAAVDAATRTPLPDESFALSGRDPVVLAVDPSDASVFYVADEGDFLNPTSGDSPSVGIERVDLAARSSTMMLGESDLGGAPVDFVLASSHDGYAIVADRFVPENPARLVHIDLDTFAVDAPLWQANNFVISGVAALSRYVVAGDRTLSGPSLHFYDRSNGGAAAVVPVNTLPPVAISRASHK